MVIDHICFATKDLKRALVNWTRLFGYRQKTEIVTNTRQNVEVVFLEKENSICIKLIAPCDGNHNLDSYIERGDSFHHLCFKCEDLVLEMEGLNSKGALKLVDPQPGEAFDNELIAFMLARFGINFELIETDKKAKVLK